MSAKEPVRIVDCPIATISPNVSVKRLSHHTNIPVHMVVAWPNATGAVALSRPDAAAGVEAASRLDALVV